MNDRAFAMVWMPPSSNVLMYLRSAIFSAVQAIQVAGAEQAVLTHFRQVNETRRQRILRDRLFTTILDYSFQNLVSVGTGVILFFAASSMQSGTGTLTVGDFALFVYALSFVTSFLDFFW